MHAGPGTRVGREGAGVGRGPWPAICGRGMGMGDGEEGGFWVLGKNNANRLLAPSLRHSKKVRPIGFRVPN